MIFSGRAFMAPMAGVSDPALRIMARRRGAALVSTEFTSIHAIAGGRHLPEHSEEERPVSVQLFGSDVGVLARAARAVEPHFDVIDYNMGCPAPHITRQMAGSALLQHEHLTRRIFRTLVESVEKPVTLKMRAGVSCPDRFLDIASIAEEEGIAMITLHPRTARQGYSGLSDWPLIGRLKEHVGIPVVGNGDIHTPQDAARMLLQTGCDYIMVGRAAMGNPFIFEQINDYLDTGSYREYTLRDRLSAFFEYAALAAGYSIRFALLKSQAMRFVRGSQGASAIRRSITAARDAAELAAVIRGALA